MISIKRLLYSLKRRFGTPIDFYEEVDTEPDVLTGKRIQQRIKHTIPLGVFLDQTLSQLNPLNKILGQLTGMMNTSRVSVLFDANDFKSETKCGQGYEPDLNDYVIIDHERYEISEIYEVDQDQSYYMKLVEFKGSQKFEQFDL